MRILFIAMADSIHTVRWINQIADQGWDIHLFPSQDSDIHPELRNVTIHDRLVHSDKARLRVKQRKSLPWPFPGDVELVNKVFNRLRRVELAPLMPNRSQRLRRLIDRIKPDIVHSLEIQYSGYTTLSAMEARKTKFPTWIVTNWGSDLYLYHRLPGHADKIKTVLDACDYYACECCRDINLAYEYGLCRGKELPVFPNTGGFDFNAIMPLKKKGKISERRLIMLKGYQHWAGRALAGIRALSRCPEILTGYTVAIFSANPDVIIAAELFSESSGIPVQIIPKNTPHIDILRFHGQAKISIGLSISDAISTSLLEAMVMGSFPIQSCTSCADEWIVDGKTGFLVPPEDPEIIEIAIRRALMDDDLVNRAAEENFRICKERLDYDLLKSKTIEMYLTVAREKKSQYAT